MPPPTLALDSNDQFAQALETCRRFLLAVANVRMPGYLVPKGGASDLVQETLLAGYQRRDQFHGTTLPELRAWLHGILRNELATFRRRYHTISRNTAREVPVETIPYRSLPATTGHTIDKLLQNERAAAVTAAVAQLPDDVRQVIVLRIEMRLGFREIGDRIGRSEEAVRKMFARSLARLRGIVPIAS